ncbi:MAG: YbaN family protein [Coriobacteriaceae bacterium]|jgi:uncharacterized membrane protein YbaN (DUF454 family)|nr:YbaN family protein [Coriobacteriaceae bacterium]
MKPLFAVLGFFFFALGAVGVVVPVLPTTPFLLLASFFFAKSSKRFHTWFTSTKLYQRHLADFVKERAMPLMTKVKILCFASSMLVIAFILCNNLHARILIAAVILFKYYYFLFRIKTVKPSQDALSAKEKDAVLQPEGVASGE